MKGDREMKKNKLCPKCGGNKIVTISNDGHPDGTYGNNIMCGATTLSSVFVDRYVCCDCGYTEEWVDKNVIEKLLNSKKAKKL